MGQSLSSSWSLGILPDARLLFRPTPRPLPGYRLVHPFPEPAVALIASRISTVSVLESYNEPGIDIIDTDDAPAILDLVLKLSAAGHKRIGFASWTYPVGGHWVARRFSGYVEALFYQGLEFNPDWVINVHKNSPRLQPPEVSARVAQLFREDKVTAWVCAADHQAYPLMQDLAARGIRVVVGQVNDHPTYERCLELQVQAVQGRFLLIPQPVAVPVLTANRMSILRLMGALQEKNPGPVELGNIIRDDAVLSYKLLSCVNSAYFALPRQLKSVQQAAIFFGVTRMRNWIETMSMCSMDDHPPELLRAALIRAHMCEKFAAGNSAISPETAFTVGLFSLLDTLMCAPMDFLLSHLRLVPEVSEALTDRSGPYGALLKQIIAWEAGEMTGGMATPQRIMSMASIYLGATQWADQVFASANDKQAA